VRRWRSAIAAASCAMAAWIAAELMVLDEPTGFGCDRPLGDWEGQSSVKGSGSHFRFRLAN